MPSLVFTSALNTVLDRTLDLTTGTFNAHLLTAVPVIGNSTVANLTLASGGSLNATASVALSGRSLSSGILDFTDPVWSSFYAGAATPIVGIAISRQAGGSPATSDPLISYVEQIATTSVANTTTASGSASITTTGTFPTGCEGQSVTGTGIPTGTIVLTRVSATQLLLNKAATAGGTVTVTVATPSTYTPPTTVGGAVTSYTVQLPASGVLQLLAS